MENTLNKNKDAMNKKYIQQRLREFLTIKDKYKNSQFKPMRYKIKDSYVEISNEIYPYLENETKIDGFIIKKAYQIFQDKTINYLQIYTKESFKRSQDYLKKQNG